MEEKKNRYKGILFIIMSAFCFALMNAFVRMAGDLPSTQKSFFRNLVALFFALVLLKKEGGRFSGKKRKYQVSADPFGSRNHWNPV